MKYWIARFVMFLAVLLVRLVRLMGVFKTWADDVLLDDDDHAQGDLIELQYLIRDHTNKPIKDFFQRIRARLPWNR